jgi:hypothetical protein
MSKNEDSITSTKNQKKTGKPANNKTRKQENEKTGLNPPEFQDKQVGISIKVAESRRRHWVSEAKRTGTTLTEVICQALSARFGEP